MRSSLISSLFSTDPRTDTVPDEGNIYASKETQGYEETVLQAMEQKGLFPPEGLDQRIALSRKDGYWPFISSGEDPPQEFVYGEFDTRFLAQILKKAGGYFFAKDNNDEPSLGNKGCHQSYDDLVFCDLGSGTGRLLLTAAALHPWKLCRGIELLEGIHQQAQEKLDFCRISRADTFSSMDPETSLRLGTGEVLPEFAVPSEIDNILPLAPVELRCGSFTDPYEFYGDANIIFVFSSCLPYHILVDLARAIGRQCLAGTIVITTEYQLPQGGEIKPCEDDPGLPSGSYAYNLLETITGENECTGGQSTVYIQRLTESVGDGQRRNKPALPVSEVAYRVIKQLESGDLSDPQSFLRMISNDMIFSGLPESWRPDPASFVFEKEALFRRIVNRKNGRR